MSLTQVRDFTHQPYTIVGAQMQVGGVGSSDDTIRDQLEKHIAVFEAKLLKKALGIELWLELKKYIDNEGLVSNAPDRWQKFINGSVYDLEGKKRYWEGVLPDRESYGLLVPYLYSKWYETSIFTPTSEGHSMIVTGDSSKKVSSSPLIECAWVDFLEKYQSNESECGVPNLVVSKFGFGLDYYHNKSSEVSLLSFLSDNCDLYPKARLGRFEMQNQFGI